MEKKKESAFKLNSKYKPSGDQPQAISELVKGIKEGKIVPNPEEITDEEIKKTLQVVRHGYGIMLFELKDNNYSAKYEGQWSFNKKKGQGKELSKDEKNMRWALNKFFYTKKKNSLRSAYACLINTEEYLKSLFLLP